MEWYLSWLNSTVWACFLPFVLIGAAFGFGEPSLVASMNWNQDDCAGFELILGFYTFILKAIMTIMAFTLWPAMTAIMYGAEMVNLSPNQTGNIGFMGLVGFSAGTWAALKLLPMIDEYFGIDPSQGISWAVRAWCFAGQVYSAVKIVKLGRTIIRKI